MTAAADASAIEARVGHYYEADGTYLVCREKVREYARAVQDYHPAHWDVAAAADLGYSGPGGAAESSRPLRPCAAAPPSARAHPHPLTRRAGISVAGREIRNAARLRV